MPNARYVQLSGPGLGESAEDLLGADDTTLALALRAGDIRAPRVAWLRFAPLVYRVLLRTFGPGRDIEDVRQDIFLAFFCKVSGLREPGALKGFLMSITARTIKYQLRRARARGIIRFWESADNLEDIEALRTAAPDDTARQTLAVFYSVLDKLSARDRALFGLRFLEGLELMEVAGSLGISVSTAKRHLARIWKRVALWIRNEPGLALDRREAEISRPGGDPGETERARR